MASTALSDPPAAARRRLRIDAISAIASEVLLFSLRSDDALQPVEPGGHLDVHLPTSEIRQYSLITPLCSRERYVIAVKREDDGRGGSRWLHEHARIGDALEVGHPRHHFVLDDAATSVLLLAGGIGITPIYSMYVSLRTLGRDVRLHYWTRSAQHALFHDVLHADPHVTFHMPGPGRPGPAEIIARSGPASAIYCCGPTRLIDECLASPGAEGRVQIERFRASDPAPSDDRGFPVTLARSGRTLMVSPGGSILDCLLAAGLDVNYSCEEGVCGACETRLLQGDVEHRDVCRSADDHFRLGTIMICCSVSRGGPITLDL